MTENMNTSFIRPTDLDHTFEDQTDKTRIDPIDNAEVMRRALYGYTWAGNRAKYGQGLLDAWNEIEKYIHSDDFEFTPYAGHDKDMVCHGLLTGLLMPISLYHGKFEYVIAESRLHALKGMTLTNWLVRQHKLYTTGKLPSGK